MNRTQAANGTRVVNGTEVVDGTPVVYEDYLILWRLLQNTFILLCKSLKKILHFMYICIGIYRSGEIAYCKHPGARDRSAPLVPCQSVTEKMIIAVLKQLVNSKNCMPETNPVEGTRHVQGLLHLSPIRHFNFLSACACQMTTSQLTRR